MVSIYLFPCWQDSALILSALKRDQAVYFPDVVTLQREKKQEIFWGSETTFFNLLTLKQPDSGRESDVPDVS